VTFADARATLKIMGTEHEPAAVSTTAKVWISVVAVSLFLWFLFAWLVLDRHLLDAAGESVGTALALGVIVSLIGALRGQRSG
jgi:hypothetical protein